VNWTEEGLKARIAALQRGLVPVDGENAQNFYDKIGMKDDLMDQNDIKTNEPVERDEIDALIETFSPEVRARYAARPSSCPAEHRSAARRLHAMKLDGYAEQQDRAAAEVRAAAPGRQRHG
jgi:hypothetical protein